MNAFTKGGLEFWDPKRAANVWTNSKNWNSTVNAFKIDMGLLKTDSHKDFLGQVWEVLSRVTWQLPQTIAGYSFSQGHNLFNGVKSVDYYGGATVVESYSEHWGGITLGSYINGQRGIKADPSNWLFQHEYGHYLQSQASGWAYLPRYGLPSAFSKENASFGPEDDHDYNPVEQDANARAIAYFSEREGLDFKWNFNKNPIGFEGTSWSMPDIKTPEFQNLLHSLKETPNVFDYFFPFISAGLNIDYYNTHYVNYQYVYYRRRR